MVNDKTDFDFSFMDLPELQAMLRDTLAHYSSHADDDFIAALAQEIAWRKQNE